MMMMCMNGKMLFRQPVLLTKGANYLIYLPVRTGREFPK
jgi:hypothetical protein